MPAIQSAFGNDYITAEGALNRAKMRAIHIENIFLRYRKKLFGST